MVVIVAGVLCWIVLDWTWGCDVMRPCGRLCDITAISSIITDVFPKNICPSKSSASSIFVIIWTCLGTRRPLKQKCLVFTARFRQKLNWLIKYLGLCCLQFNRPAVWAPFYPMPFTGDHCDSEGCRTEIELWLSVGWNKVNLTRVDFKKIMGSYGPQPLPPLPPPPQWGEMSDKSSVEMWE